MGISIGHLIVILVILMLVFGPSRLEGLGSSLGKAVRGFKDAVDGIDDLNKVPVVKVANAPATDKTNQS